MPVPHDPSPARAAAHDGTFRTRAELEAIYQAEQVRVPIAIGTER